MILNYLSICVFHCDTELSGFPVGASSKESACQCRRHETLVQSLGWEDLLEEGMATHVSSLAWRIPWTEEPGGPQFIGSQRVGYRGSNLACTHLGLVAPQDLPGSGIKPMSPVPAV